MIDWLLKLGFPNSSKSSYAPVNQPQVYLALFLDWLVMCDTRFIMDVEPAMLLMAKTSVSQPQITQVLLGFLLYFIRDYPRKIKAKVRIFCMCVWRVRSSSSDYIYVLCGGVFVPLSFVCLFLRKNSQPALFLFRT